jgi:Holliday junction resolvase RusA-like endonuclease
MLSLDLPQPPSVNHIWRFHGGGAFRTPAYTSWLETAGWELKAQRPAPLPAGSALAITIRAGKPDRARDLDNLVKGLLDLLEAHGVIENDGAVHDLRICWDAHVPPGRARVSGSALGIGVAEPTYHVPVILSPIEAGEEAGVTDKTIRNWCRDDGIGYLDHGEWRIKSPAHLIRAAQDTGAAADFSRDGLASPRVQAYLRRPGRAA